MRGIIIKLFGFCDNKKKAGDGCAESTLTDDTSR